MNEPFDPSSIPTEEYDAQIARLEERLEADLAAFKKTEAKLKWWREGRALYASDTPRISPLQEVIGDLAPVVPVGAANGSPPASKPVLREAIFEVMRQDASRPWKAQEILRALEERGWMPNGANASHIVRSRLSTLTKAGQLRRAGYGQYGFPEGVEAP